MSSFGERLKARRRMQEQSYRNMKRVRQKNIRITYQLESHNKTIDSKKKGLVNSFKKEKEALEDLIDKYKEESKIVKRNIRFFIQDKNEVVIRTTSDMTNLKCRLEKLTQDVDYENENIKKFKRLPKGSFLPKISVDPIVPLRLIERDLKDLRRSKNNDMIYKFLLR